MSRSIEQTATALRVEVASATLRSYQRNMGSSHYRPLCMHGNNTTPKVQQQVPRPSDRRDRRSESAELGSGEQLCESPIQTDRKGAGRHHRAASYSNTDSPTLAKQTLVPEARGSLYRPADTYTHQAVGHDTDGKSGRATQKQTLEAVRLEDLWQTHLSGLGWSEAAITRYLLHWSKATLDLYNRLLTKFKVFCQDTQCAFPPTDSSDIAEYMCSVAASSDRPRSQLVSTSAAIGWLYKALGIKNPMHEDNVQTLISGLVKSSTTAPRAKTAIMPVQPFYQLFKSWPDNTHLSVADIRLKAICLLGLAFMLRPSDVALHGQVIDTESNEVTNMVFKESQVSFNEDSSLTMVFHGIKNDGDRSGFPVTISAAADTKIDPVAALSEYMTVTAETRRLTIDHPVFLSLTNPPKALSSRRIAKVLCDSIDLAGLGGKGFTAKSFRPTGASKAVNMGCDPNIARAIGRWKTQEVFEQHYVHSKVPADYVDKLLM